MISGCSGCAPLQPRCWKAQAILADLREPLLRLRVGDARFVLAHLLGHVVLMAVVVQMLRTQLLGFSARRIDVTAGYLPGIAPRRGSVHRPGWPPQARAPRPTQRRPQPESSSRCHWRGGPSFFFTLFTSDETGLRTTLSPRAGTQLFGRQVTPGVQIRYSFIETQLAQAEEPRCLMIDFLPNAFGAH